MRVWQWGILVVLLSVSLSHVGSVQACSGSSEISLEEVVKTAEIAVLGKFVEYDDARSNGIFQVTSYLMGEPGPEYILLALNNPLLIEAVNQGRETGGMCPHTERIPLGDGLAVVFLNHQQDGSYTWVTLKSGLYQFDSQTPEISVFYQYTPTTPEDAFRSFTLEQMLAYILDKSGQSPISPLIDKPYPMTIPLMVTTDLNNHYLLPVDGSKPILLTEDQAHTYEDMPIGCNTPPCTAVSPNQLGTARLFPGNEPFAGTTISDNLFYWPVFQGDALLFSSTNETIAIWNGNQIEIFNFYYPQLGFYELEPVSLLTKTVLNLDGISNFIPGQAAWSSDGRYLAFSDRSGLWLWDVFSLNRSAQLLLPANSDIPYARYFSPRNRYLAVVQGNERFTIDIDTGMRLPDGLVSPDDRKMLVFDTADRGTFDLSILLLAPLGTIPNAAIQCVMRAEWISESTFLMSQCDHGYATEEGYVDEDYYVVSENTFPQLLFGGIFGYAFDYVPQTSDLAVIQDATSVWIQNKQRQLSAFIEGDLAEIKWLKPLFYYAGS